MQSNPILLTDVSRTVFHCFCLTTDICREFVAARGRKRAEARLKKVKDSEQADGFLSYTGSGVVRYALIVAESRAEAARIMAIALNSETGE